MGIHMNKCQKMILGISQNIIYAVFTVICFYLFFLSLFTTCFMVYTDEHVFYLKDFAIVMCIGLAALCAVLTLIRKRFQWKEKNLRLMAVTATVILSVFLAVFILTMRLVPIYDQSSVYYAAKSLLSGDYKPWMKGEYFSMLAYQNGMVLLMCPFVALFRDAAFLVFQLSNIPVMLLTYLGIAKITENYFGKKSAYAAYLLLLGMVPAWTLVTFVYGTWPALCSAVWAIWFEIQYEKSGKWRYPVYAGICMMFSIMCKSNSEIFLVAVCIMFLLHMVRTRSWKPAAGAAIVVFFSILEIKGVPLLFHWITGQNTTSGIPFIAWLAMGMQESSIAPGWYNEFPTNLYKKLGPDSHAITQASLQSFQTSFTLFGQQKVYAVRFFARKLASMWADPAFQCFTGVNTRNLHGTFPYWVKDVFYNGGIANTVIYLLLDVLQSIQYFGLILFLVLRRKSQKLTESHLIVCILGGFLFHLIGEAKSHYVLGYYMMMVPYAVQGYLLATGKLQAVLEMRHAGRIQTGQSTENKKRTAISGTGRIFLMIGTAVLLITFLRGPVVTATVRLGGQERDYIWYCTHETEWKNADYVKH